MVPRATQVLNPKGSPVGAAVFAGLTSVTDRPTDHATRSVRIGRIYVRSTAMRPKNKSYYYAMLEQYGLNDQMATNSSTQNSTGLGLHRQLAKDNTKLECGSMANVMVALQNAGGALSSTPQSLADVRY